MPNLMPRDIHHLWMQPNEKTSNKNKSDSSRNNLFRRNQEDDSELNQRQRILYAPPLSAYSSERPGAMLPSRESQSSATASSTETDFNDLIFNDIEQKMRELRSIRTLGDSYLAPVGVGKTMKTLHEEMQIKEQMKEQYQHEAPTAENLLGEGDNVVEDEDIEGSDQVGEALQRNEQPIQPDGQEETQATEQIDLDDEIPEAEENTYDHIYDQANDMSENEIEYDDQTAYERQYDEGFMVSEEYQQDDEEVTPRNNRPTGVNYTREQIRTPEYSPVNNETSGRQNATFSSSFNSFSRNVRDSFNDTTTHPGDISINESDLDMVLDDDD